jgi:hypothetical protein
MVKGDNLNQPPGGMPNHPYAAYPMPMPSVPAKRNAVGLIALIASVIGFVFACIPGALVVGWVLLPIALILGIVGVALSGMSKGTSISAIITSIVGIVVGVVVFLALVGNAFSNAFHNSDLSSAPSAASGAPSNTQTSVSYQPGSRENPFPIGERVQSRDWQVSLGAPHEAGARIAAENQFNDPPKAGMEYWIVPVAATYTGDRTGNLGSDITVKFVGSDNRTYDDSCGVIPNPLSDVGDLYKGGSAKGNVCVEVPARAAGLWTLTTGFGDPAFFTAK